MIRSVKRITSRQNPLVARYRAVGRGDERNLILLDGLHLVGEAETAGLHFHHALVAGEAIDRREVQALVARLEARDVEVATASAPVMAAASPVRSSSPIVALVERPAHLEERFFAGPSPLVLIACEVQDPGNVGAIARVAEAGGASGLIVAGACADPFGWKALRGSMGSALRLPIAVRASADQAVREARQRRCRVVAAVPHDGRSIFDADLSGPMAILVGGEGRGLPPALIDGADERVTIPMQSPVESLNTAVTAALLVYEARRQRHAPGRR